MTICGVIFRQTWVLVLDNFTQNIIASKWLSVKLTTYVSYPKTSPDRDKVILHQRHNRISCVCEDIPNLFCLIAMEIWAFPMANNDALLFNEKMNFKQKTQMDVFCIYIMQSANIQSKINVMIWRCNYIPFIFYITSLHKGKFISCVLYWCQWCLGIIVAYALLRRQLNKYLETTPNYSASLTNWTHLFTIKIRILYAFLVIYMYIYIFIVSNKLVPNRPLSFAGMIMITSWNGNTFRVTGHLCGEFNGPRWILRTKASDG